MRKIILISLFIACFGYLNYGCGNDSSFTSKAPKVDSNLTLTLKSNYEVYKIDSLHNYYLIYIVKNKERYKLVSEKTSQAGCDMISAGKVYNFQVTEAFGFIAGGVFKPICLSVNDSTKVCLEDSILDICIPENINGLCITNPAQSIR